MVYWTITYTNWRGETSKRNITYPNGRQSFLIEITETSWHGKELTFDALDLDKGCIRTFALNNIQGKWEEHSQWTKQVPEPKIKGSGV